MPGLDWRGLEKEKCKGWYYKHLFQYPLYFVEYGYAWVGAVDIYGNYLDQPQETLNTFENALKLGMSQAVSDIYTRAGGHFSCSTCRCQTHGIHHQKRVVCAVERTGGTYGAVNRISQSSSSR